MTIVDNAVYVGGRRTEDPPSLRSSYDITRERGGFCWIGLANPSLAEIREVADEFGLHRLAVEDALEGHQRAKLERYGDSLFVVLRPARYLDREEEVRFGEVDLFVGPDSVIVVRGGDAPDLHAVRLRLESEQQLLAHGPMAVLYAVCDQVVDDYAPVVRGLENDIDEIEDQLFGGDAGVSQRIYELSREVLLFQRAIAPLSTIVESLRSTLEGDDAMLEVRRSLRDVLDHVVSLQQRVEAFRALLQNALSVNATLVAQRQNEQTQQLTEASYRQGEQVKRISSWAAIAFAPALIASIYGMNFTNMPELHWTYGYPFSLVLMLAVAVLLYVLFRRRNWI